jgi:predicted lipid-binding transport protein (Tim44 family)
MDNAILRDRADPLERARQRRLRGVAAPLAAAAGVGFLWFVTGNVFILIPALILLLMLRGLLRLIDTIKPTDPGSRTPPQLPPPGMGL